MADMGLDTKTTTYELGHSGPDLRQTYVGLTRLMASQTSLDDSISNGNKYVKKTFTDSLTL